MKRHIYKRALALLTALIYGSGIIVLFQSYTAISLISKTTEMSITAMRAEENSDGGIIDFDPASAEVLLHAKNEEIKSYEILIRSLHDASVMEEKRSMIGIFLWLLSGATFTFWIFIFRSTSDATNKFMKL